MKAVTIIGAGLVGSLWAVLLAKRGYQVHVYERRSDMRKNGFVGGRSINLALSDRGWKAIKIAGIEAEIRENALPMYRRLMHDIEGNLIEQAYGKENQAIYSVSRGGLNLALINIADSFENVSFFFDHTCIEYDLNTERVDFQQLDGNIVSVYPSLLFATDGAFSAVRNSLQKRPRFNYSQHFLDHAYKELSIPADANAKHQLDSASLHIWPRGDFMMIALPNIDGSFTCTLFLAYEGEVSFENLDSDEKIVAFFQKYFPDAVTLMPHLLEEFKGNPTSPLATIRCFPWSYKNTLMFGDASHGIVPFYGQGMNSGFEDCTILNDMATQFNENWEQVFELFNKTRPKDANAIADLALRNFIEMRDKVGDEAFLLRKKIGLTLNESFPKEFTEMYSLVTFSHVPYSIALKEAEKQDAFFSEVLQLEGIDENNWKNNPSFWEIFKRYFSSPN